MTYWHKNKEIYFFLYEILKEYTAFIMKIIITFFRWWKWQCQPSRRGILIISGRSETRSSNVLAGRHFNSVHENQKQLGFVLYRGCLIFKRRWTFDKMETRVTRSFSSICKLGFPRMPRTQFRLLWCCHMLRDSKRYKYRIKISTILINSNIQLFLWDFFDEINVWRII